jgi:hypothetical protein
VAYSREKVSQNSAMPNAINEQSFPSLSPPIPFHFILSIMPETISKGKTKEDEKQNHSSKKAEKYSSPNPGISIPLFLE